jgi:hypothetical protein
LNNATQRLMDDNRLDDAKALLALALDGAAGSTRAALLQNLANVAVAQSQQARAAGRLREARTLLDEAMATGTTSTTMQQQIAAAAADLDGQLAADSGDESRCAALKSSAEQQRCFVSASQVLAQNGKVAAALSAARAGRALDDAALPESRANGASVLFNALVLSIRAADKDRDCNRVEALSRDVVVVAKGMKNAPAFPAAQVMGQCWWARASAAADADAVDDAARFFSRALVHLPDDQGLRGNLREMDLRRAHTLAKAGRCDEARPWATRHVGDDEGRGRQLLELCANERAVGHAKTKDWSGAVVELRRGLIDAPGSAVLDDNLGRMLHNLALDFLKAKRCDDAAALVPELKARKQTDIVDDVAAICR